MAYKTVTDFDSNFIMNMTSAVVSAVPVFFPVTLFILWIFGSGASYYSILVTTGKKRFWHSLTAMSFVMFLVSLLIAGMNTADITYLSGYWVGFYVLMTLASWFMLATYK